MANSTSDCNFAAQVNRYQRGRKNTVCVSVCLQDQFERSDKENALQNNKKGGERGDGVFIPAHCKCGHTRNVGGD